MADNLNDLIDGLFSDDSKDVKKAKTSTPVPPPRQERVEEEVDIEALLNRTPGTKNESPKENVTPTPKKESFNLEDLNLNFGGGVTTSEKPVKVEPIQTSHTSTMEVDDDASGMDRSKYENTSSTDLSVNSKFDSDAYNQYSAAVDEIMNYIPNWLIRWGNTLIASIVGLILLFSYLIKYPDIINGSVTMTTTNPPVAIFSKSEGEIDLLYEDKSIVIKDDVIAVIERDASYEDIQYLKTVLDRDLSTERNSIISDLSTRPLRLGAVQPAFSNFFSQIQNSIIQGNEYSTNNDRIGKFNQQIQLTNSLMDEQKKQIRVLEDEYAMAQSVIKERYQPMYSNGSISREQLERKILESNDKYNRLQESKKRLSEYEKTIIDIQSQIANMKFSNSRITNNVQGNTTDALSKLNNSITNWEHNYLIKAPTSGEISFASFLKDYTYIRREQELAFIVPQSKSGQDSIYAEVMLEGKGSGRLELGQRVLIELDAYPKKQYGRLTGVLANISEVATDIKSAEGSTYFYKAKVALPDGFQSTTDREIVFRPNMPGKAQVITKDVRLIQRLFNEIYNAFDY